MSCPFCRAPVETASLVREPTKMQVFVKKNVCAPFGEPVQTNALETIGMLKKRIWLEFGVPACLQFLAFGSRCLDDDGKRLGDYDIARESTLTLVLRSCDKPRCPIHRRR